MENLKDDLLSEVKNIAAYLDKDEQVTGRLLRKGEIPGFRIGGIWHARKSELNAAFRSAA